MTRQWLLLIGCVVFGAVACVLTALWLRVLYEAALRWIA